MLYAFLAILSGMLISGQSSCNGLLYPFIGVIAVGFVSQLLNAVTSFFFSLIYFHRPPRLKGLPFYDYFGGVCAMFVLGFSGYLVAHLGTAVTVCLSVSGQLFMSAIVDHFGWFGSEKVPFKARRLPGFFCILAGVFVINFAGANTFQGISGRGFLFLLLIFAILVGCVTVFARMFNFEASKYVGKLDGNFANAGFGSIVSFIIYLISVKGQLSFSGFASAPALGYLTGPIGAISCVLNSLSYAKMKVFHATIFLLIGQISAGILVDLIMYRSFPLGKLIGILIICVGIFFDKKYTAPKAA